jgi:drug/metabolite transporter (DMT)-like permease
MGFKAVKAVKVVLGFFDNFSNAPKTRIFLFSLISGIAYALALAAINSTIQHVSAGNDSLKVNLLVTFVLACLVHVVFMRRSVNMGTVAAENVIKNVKVGITGKVPSTPV